MNPSAPAKIVDMQGVTLFFNNTVGVQDLDLQVASGTIFGLIGPSGCGKTTTIRLMTGILKPQKGELRVMGHIPSKFSVSTRERIGYMPQSFVLYPNLTVWENLNFVADLYGLGWFRRRKRLNQLLEFVELGDARGKLGSQLSGGMQRRLELACSLAHDPDLLFADEPTAGIDPVLRGKFWNHFRTLRDAGHTLFITTQYVGEAAYCDFVGVMHAGHLIHIDTPEGLRQTALGGEVIRLVTDEVQVGKLLSVLRAVPQDSPLCHMIKRIERANNEPGTIYVYVVEASDALPAIFGLMEHYPDLTIHQAEEYLPPYDDIFIKLMEQAEKSDA